MYGRYSGCCFFFFQAEDGIRDLVRSRGLGDVYKRQVHAGSAHGALTRLEQLVQEVSVTVPRVLIAEAVNCLLYTSDAADERSSVDLGGRRIIKKKKQHHSQHAACIAIEQQQPSMK